MPQLRLRELWIYPVKSTQGTAVQTAKVTLRGLEHDRRWMVVDAAGRFLTQREYPALACVTSRVDDCMLHLTAPGMAALEVAAFPTATTRQVQIWKDTCAAAALAPEASAWFSRFLGTPCELVRMPDSTERIVDTVYSPAQRQVGFADGYPFLLANTASLRELNSRLETPVPMSRFRPNIVVDAEPAFAEDTWRSMRVGTCEFSIVKPCGRCVIVNTDQETGARGREPLRTLSTYRRFGKAVVFGQNMVHTGTGIVRVGDLADVSLRDS